MSNIQSVSNEQIWNNLTEIRTIFAKDCSNEEFAIFVKLGKSLGLNPFNREIWITKNKEKNTVNIFVGRDGYRRIAQEQKDYDGHIVEAIYSNDNFKIENGVVNHTFSFKDRGKLIGAYCEVYRKGISKPLRVIVKFEEYNLGTRIWQQKPETMIKKVAEAQGLRMAYQGIFAGTYDESEAWIEEKESKIINIQNEQNQVNQVNQGNEVNEQNQVNQINEVNEQNQVNEVNEVKQVKNSKKDVIAINIYNEINKITDDRDLIRKIVNYVCNMHYGCNYSELKNDSDKLAIFEFLKLHKEEILKEVKGE